VAFVPRVIACLFAATAVNFIQFDHRQRQGGITVTARTDPAAAKAYAEYFTVVLLIR
jgi:hypothetical protein